MLLANDVKYRYTGSIVPAALSNGSADAQNPVFYIKNPLETIQTTILYPENSFSDNQVDVNGHTISF